MPINASDIASLGLTGGNPVQSMEQGYKLADLVDQRAINKMKMQGVQQEMQDVQTIKNVLSKHDVSTPEGQAKAAAEVIKISPEYGLKLQKAFTDQQTGQNENLKSELEIIAKKNDVLSAAAVPVYMQIQKMRADGRTDAEIDAAVMPAVTQVISTLKNQTLPNGKPILSPEEMQGVVSGLQRGGLADAMDTWMMNSEKTKGLIESRLKAESKFGPTKTMTGDQGPGVYERNERTGKWTKVGGMAPTAAERGGGGAGGGAGGAGAMPAGGIDMGLVKSIGTYGRPPLSARERNTPAGQAVMAEVRKQYPEYKEYQYKVIGDAVNRFSTGKQGDTLRSIGTSMRHISTLEETVDALKNGDVAMLNRLGNVLQNELGLSSAPNDFDTIKGLVADEINKAVVGGAGTGGERQELQQKIKSSLKPETLASALKYLKELMGGQLLGLEYQYKSATGLKDFEDRFLGEQPEVVDLLLSEKERTKGSGKGAGPAGGAPKQITEGTIIYSNDPTKPNKILRGGKWQVMQ